MKKKFVVMLAVLALLLAGVAAALSGALNDPLISLEYLQQTFLPTIKKQIGQQVEAKHKSIYDTAAKKLEQETAALRSQLGVSSGAWSYSGGFVPRKLAYQDSLTLQEGSGLLFLEGTAAATASGGELIDVTEGTAGSSMTLTANHRYLAGEQATVTLVIQSEAAELALSGYYKAAESGQDALPFADIDRTMWYYGAVSYVYDQGLFSGISEDQFAPNHAVTRGMLATVLHRIAETPAPNDAGVSFRDVPSGAWFEPGVRWSASVGIVQGMEAGLFGPDHLVTREQLGVMLYRYATDYLNMDTSDRGALSQFTDQGTVSDWAQEGLSWANAVGILNGNDKGALNPGGSATRAEAATMIQRFAKLIS